MCCVSQVSTKPAFLLNVGFFDRPRAAIVENDDTGADELCAPPENATLDLFGNGSETKPIVQCLGDPPVSLGDIAKMNAAMMIRHGVIIALVGGLANELKCLARPDVFIDIFAAIDPSRRFDTEACYPARVGPHAALREQG
jgi:hypothetical protein